MNYATNKSAIMTFDKRIKQFLPLPFVLGVITSIFTVLKMNSGDNFINKWLPYYGLALVIVIPIAIILISFINQFIQNSLENNKPLTKGLAFGLPFTAIIGTLMTGVAVYSFNSIDSLSDFFSTWILELGTTIPIFLSVGLVIGIFRAITLRKKA